MKYLFYLNKYILRVFLWFTPLSILIFKNHYVFNVFILVFSYFLAFFREIINLEFVARSRFKQYYLVYIYVGFVLLHFSGNLSVYFQGLIVYLLPILFLKLYINYKFTYNQSLMLFLWLMFNAIIGYLNFFYDFDFFGLIQHEVYTDKIFYNSNVEKRSISFYMSPQSNSLALLMLFYLLIMYIGHYKAYYLKFLFFFFSILTIYFGFLTGSKSFIIGLLPFGLFFSRRSLALMLLGCIVFLFVGIDSEFRGFEIFRVLNEIEDYSAVVHWVESLNYFTNFYDFLWGRGIGTMGSIAEKLEIQPLVVPSTESFVLQIFVETGFIGVLFLSYFLYRLLKTEHRMLVAIVFTNALFTPALYGVNNLILISCILLLSRNSTNVV